jgi:GDSL-like Lipase/Acylhydrolase family
MSRVSGMALGPSGRARRNSARPILCAVAALMLSIAFCAACTGKDTAVAPARSLGADAKRGSGHDALHIVVVADAMTVGARGQGLLDSPTNWTVVLQSALERDLDDVQIVVDARAGTGYATGGTSRFAARVPAALATGDTDLVLMVGGGEDHASPEEVDAGIREAIEAVQSAKDGPALLVVGPVSVQGLAGPQTSSIVAALQERCLEFGIPYVDPVQAGWLGADAGTTVGGVPGLMSDAGHRALGEGLAPLVLALTTGS